MPHYARLHTAADKNLDLRRLDGLIVQFEGDNVSAITLSPKAEGVLSVLKEMVVLKPIGLGRHPDTGMAIPLVNSDGKGVRFCE